MDIPFVEFGEEIRPAFQDGPFLSGGVGSDWQERVAPRRRIGFRTPEERAAEAMEDDGTG